MSFYDYKGDPPDEPEPPVVYQDAEWALDTLRKVTDPALHGLNAWLEENAGFRKSLADTDKTLAEDVFGYIEDAVMAMEDAPSSIQGFIEAFSRGEYDFEPDWDSMRGGHDDY